jgi:signal-transduction protein with cAMP-binding, CBS, and nucleotidyltransferase domain
MSPRVSVGDGPLHTLPRRPTLIVPPGTSVREALGLMDRGQCDAAVVADEQSRLPPGLVTLSDLVLRISVDRVDLDEPVAAIMTAAPATLPADAPSHRATVLMSKRFARYVVLVDRDWKVSNLLSQADLFGMRGGGAETLAERVAQATDVGAMIKAADAIRRGGAELFAAGMGIEFLCNWMSAFFDFRPLYGSQGLVDSLRKWLLPQVPWYPRFLRIMAEDALTCTPALGWMGRFAYDDGRRHPHTIDLKLPGVRPFVDAARIWSLAHGVWATSTADRLREVSEILSWRLDTTAAAVEAFLLVQRFRIQQQLTTKDPDRVNRIDLSSLNELNKRMLKEAFKQAKRVQQRLRLDYGF